MRSPNWSEEELKLALELYLDRDASWHSRVSNSTWEIQALSNILRGMDVVLTESIENFRSVNSVRLKLANFKSLDENYRKTAMTNVGCLDKEIWNQYHKKGGALRLECIEIIKRHFKGEKTDAVVKYLHRLEEHVAN